MPPADIPAASCPVSIILADWRRDEAAIAGIRRSVFIEEQAVPEDMEWEAVDPACDWFIARDAAGRVVGIVRLVPDGHVGRMAVLPDWRRRGIGSRLLGAVLEHARRRGFARAVLHAQIQAQPFYLKHGFQPEGEVFMEAGIPHQRMHLSLTQQP